MEFQFGVLIRNYPLLISGALVTLLVAAISLIIGVTLGALLCAARLSPGGPLNKLARAYILFFRVLASAGATNAAIVTFLIPVSAILLGTLVLGERLEPRHLAGMALIGLGLAVIDGRPGARLSAALRPRA